MRKYLIAAAFAVAVLIIAFGVRQQLPRTAAQEHAPVTPRPAAERTGSGAPDGADPPVTDAERADPAETPPPVAAPPAPGAGPGLATSPRGAEPTTPAGPPPAAVAPPAAGVQPDEATRILQAAADRYAQVRTLRAEFTMHHENPLLRTTTTSRGTLMQQRPDRIALRFSEPDGDVIVGDGQFFWVYYPSVNAQQVIRQPAGAAGAGGVDLQAQFLGDPVRRFEHTLHGTETVAGRDAYAMTLVPRERAEFTRLRVWIDTRDQLVRRFEITEANGAVRRFDLDNLQTNVAVPADAFRFVPPASARIVERG